MSSILDFREKLQAISSSEFSRPFLCDGNPLLASIFVVGFNPATQLKVSFWNFWSDSDGYDQSQFMEEYLKTRKLAGARPRIQLISSAASPQKTLETNICATPTKRASQLLRNDRRTEQFEFLFDAIRPRIAFLHSNEPIAFFENRIGKIIPPDKLTDAGWNGHQFRVLSSPGPLWRMSFEEASRIGARLREALD